jgi:hypothetical protein
VCRNKVFVIDYYGNTSSKRVVTLSSIIHYSSNLYIFTAGHPLNKTSVLGLPRERKVINEEWEIKSDNESDNDSDTEVDISGEDFDTMSRASNTPVDARLEKSPWSNEGSLDTHSISSL